MCNKNSYLVILCLCVYLLSGCSSNSSFQSNDKEPENNPSKQNSGECREIDPMKTSLLTSGVTYLATLNPIAVVIVGGVTFFTVDSKVFDCDKIEKQNSNKQLN
ncbi:MAG: hypothetical protein OCD00_19090 [Colwellia sp.]